MSDEPIEMDVSGISHTITGTTPIGCADVETPYGLVHFCEGNGLFTSVIEANGEVTPPTAGAILVYVSGENGEKGRGVMIQLNAGAMRDIAASLLAKADELDPQRPN